MGRGQGLGPPAHLHSCSQLAIKYAQAMTNSYQKTKPHLSYHNPHLHSQHEKQNSTERTYRRWYSRLWTTTDCRIRRVPDFHLHRIWHEIATNSPETPQFNPIATALRCPLQLPPMQNPTPFESHQPPRDIDGALLSKLIAISARRRSARLDHYPNSLGAGLALPAAVWYASHIT